MSGSRTTLAGRLARLGFADAARAECLLLTDLGGVGPDGGESDPATDPLLTALAARHGVAAAYDRDIFPAVGGLMSYGTNEAEMDRMAGSYVARILKGAKPADLPVEKSTKVDFVINLKPAKALGLNVPLPLLGRADEVIE